MSRRRAVCAQLTRWLATCRFGLVPSTPWRDSADAAAQEHVARARAYAEAKDWDRAIVELEAACGVDEPRIATLHDLAQAYSARWERLGSSRDCATARELA